MTFMDGRHTESDKLIQQLAGLEYIVDSNSNILNQDPFARDFLAFKMEVAQSFIEESQLWRTMGNQRKCDAAVQNANIFLEQTQTLLDGILNEYCEKAWLDFQRELAFTSPVFTYYAMPQ